MVRAALALLLFAAEARAEWVGGVRAGVAFPRELDPCLVVGIEGGRFFSPVGILGAVEYEQPSAEVSGEHATLGPYTARLTRRTLAAALRVVVRAELGAVSPYLAAGPRLVVVSLRSSGAAGDALFGETIDTHVEAAVEAAAGAGVGPFLLEVLFHRGEDSGAWEIRAGYRFGF